MYGAILGDMIGAPYEFDKGRKTKDFPLFVEKSRFTDDTVMSIAVAEALMEVQNGTVPESGDLLVRSMQKWGRKYPDAGYGGRFRRWLRSKDPVCDFFSGCLVRFDVCAYEIGNCIRSAMCNRKNMMKIPATIDSFSTLHHIVIAVSICISAHQITVEVLSVLLAAIELFP